MYSISNSLLACSVVVPLYTDRPVNEIILFVVALLTIEVAATLVFLFDEGILPSYYKVLLK